MTIITVALGLPTLSCAARSALLSSASRLMVFLDSHEIPSATTVISLEAHDWLSDLCTIVLAVGSIRDLAGRAEPFGHCIYGSRRAGIGHVVTVDEARSRVGYLEVHPSTNSEIYCEASVALNTSAILNAEFSTLRVPKRALQWFTKARRVVFPRE